MPKYYCLFLFDQKEGVEGLLPVFCHLAPAHRVHHILQEELKYSSHNLDAYVVDMVAVHLVGLIVGSLAQAARLASVEGVAAGNPCWRNLGVGEALQTSYYTDDSRVNEKDGKKEEA